MDDNLLQMFVEDTRGDLADIESDLVDFEEGAAEYDPELVTRIFRTAHAIKGSASLLGLDKIREIAHRLENILDMVRGKEMEPTPTVIETVVAAFDTIDEMVNDIETGEVLDTQQLMNAMTNLISASLPPERHEALVNTSKVMLPGGRVVFNISEHDLIQARKSGNFLYLVEYDLIADVHRKNKTPLELLDFLEKSGLLLDCKMDISAVGTLDEELTRRIPLYVLYATILEEDLVRAVFQVDAAYIHVVERDEEQGVERAKPLAQPEHTRRQSTTSIDKDDLDSMEAAFDESLARMAASSAHQEMDEENMDAEETTDTTDSGTIVLSGSLSIEHAAELKDKFLQALDAGGDVSVDLSGVESADVTFLQVLWAAYKSAEQHGVRISLAGGIPDSLKELANLAGLADLTPEIQLQPNFPLMGAAVEG